MSAWPLSRSARFALSIYAYTDDVMRERLATVRRLQPGDTETRWWGHGTEPPEIDAAKPVMSAVWKGIFGEKARDAYRVVLRDVRRATKRDLTIELEDDPAYTGDVERGADLEAQAVAIALTIRDLGDAPSDTFDVYVSAWRAVGLPLDFPAPHVERETKAGWRMTERVPASERMALTVEEAAKELGISRSLAYRWVAEGVLPAFRVGKVVRVPRRALEEWLASQPDRRPA